MKTLYLIRHAKSDQSFFGNDFERPLNARGLKDARIMAKKLIDKNIHLDALVSSPALRAKTTAELFATAFKIKSKEIIFKPELYHASAKVLNEVVAVLSNEWQQVAIFCHNPGITYFADELVEDVSIDNMPTCGIFAVQLDKNNWSDFEKSTKTFLFFDWPKNV